MKVKAVKQNTNMLNGSLKSPDGEAIDGGRKKLENICTHVSKMSLQGVQNGGARFAGVESEKSEKS